MTKIEELSDILRCNGHKLCVAESFTGGGIASDFVALSGASEIFSFGAVCYSNDAKIKILGVDANTINTYGAVSEQTVSKMLDGLRQISLGDIFVATSGNAGPSAEREGEVGVFYIGVMFGLIKTVRRFAFKGSRTQVIDFGKDCAYDMLLEVLKSNLKK